MNAIDATSRSVEADAGAPPSLLTVILDTNPHAWNLIASTLPLSKAVANLLVFLNAHLAINPANRVAVLASHVERAEWLYPTPADRNSHGDLPHSESEPPPAPPDDANKYRPFAALERALTANLSALLDFTSPASLSATPTTLTAGALTLALTHISKLTTLSQSSVQTAQTKSFNYSDPNSTSTADAASQPATSTARILILSLSPDNPPQYIPLMNAIFAAQRLSIPVDILPLSPTSTSTFLQQASDATSGLYLPCTTPAAHAALLQYLMFAFLPDNSARGNLIAPAQQPGEGGVDFRAACFCHRRIVDVGFVCSICLSIFCEILPEGSCLTCGSVLAIGAYGRKPVVVPKKKKKKRKIGENGDGSGTPVAT